MRNLFLLSLIISLLVSCETGTDTPLNDDNTSNPGNSYMPLEIGNYWIYQHVDITSQGQETVRDITDSIVVDRDTVIDGNQYFVIEGTNYPYDGGKWGTLELLKDSSGYIVNHEGVVRFSEENFTDTLAAKTEVIDQDTLYRLTYKMEEVDGPYSSPAGSFTVLNCKGTVLSFQELPGINNPRYMNNYYAKGVGRVLQTYMFYHSPVIREKRLIRYHVKNIPPM